MRASALSLLAFLLVVAPGCSRSEPEPPRPEDRAKPEAPASAAPVVSAAPTTTNAANAANGPLILARGVRIVHAGLGIDAARVVREEREKAKSDGRDLVVYVGATWCEPCQVFHKAAQRGELDGEFPDLTLLEFDLDQDRDRLTAAGYVGQYIPLFAMPDATGRASDKKFEGSVKGNGAVANIAPRLRKILGR